MVIYLEIIESANVELALPQVSQEHVSIGKMADGGVGGGDQIKAPKSDPISLAGRYGAEQSRV